MASEHTVKSYDEELQRLHATIFEMGGRAENQVGAAMRAFASRDSDLAGEVVQQDARVDSLEREVDQLMLRLLALRAPVARDLRDILAASKIAADLERICDYAANIAKRSIVLNQSPAVQQASGLLRMGQLAQAQINAVLDAYTERDADKALEVWNRDEELDSVYTSLFRELLTYMMEDARIITSCTHLLFIAKNVERIGDHATNIAETIYFMVSGVPLTQLRPKADRSVAESGTEEMP